MEISLSCKDVGFDCDYVIKGNDEEKIMEGAVKHAWEGHAIKPQEMTTEMRVKIKENIKEL